MADNFLENQRADYEAKKANWLKHRKRIFKTSKDISKPDDESL